MRGAREPVALYRPSWQWRRIAISKQVQLVVPAVVGESRLRDCAICSERRDSLSEPAKLVGMCPLLQTPSTFYTRVVVHAHENGATDVELSGSSQYTCTSYEHNTGIEKP